MKQYKFSVYEYYGENPSAVNFYKFKKYIVNGVFPINAFIQGKNNELKNLILK